MPAEALVHRPRDIACRPLGVGELSAEATALLLEGPRAGALPHQFPADRGVVTPHGRQLPLGAVQVRTDPLQLLQAAILLGGQGLARGLGVFQVTPQVLETGLPQRGTAPRIHGGATPCPRRLRAPTFTRAPVGHAVQVGHARRGARWAQEASPVTQRHMHSGPHGRGRLRSRRY